jgi:hypothetical protein
MIGMVRPAPASGHGLGRLHRHAYNRQALRTLI